MSMSWTVQCHLALQKSRLHPAPPHSCRKKKFKVTDSSSYPPHHCSRIYNPWRWIFWCVFSPGWSVPAWISGGGERLSRLTDLRSTSVTLQESPSLINWSCQLHVQASPQPSAVSAISLHVSSSELLPVASGGLLQMQAPRCRSPWSVFSRWHESCSGEESLNSGITLPWCRCWVSSGSLEFSFFRKYMYFFSSF